MTPGVSGGSPLTGKRSGSEDRALYLFPHTNVFIQCHALNEVDWSDLVDCAEIQLIVCQPVQREMDKHKNRGNDRVGKRARKTCSMFRQIILGEQDYQLIRNDGPRIILSLDASIAPISSQLPSLDYSKQDDQIVGHIHAYCQQHEDQDVRLLTHDIGPMMTDQSIGLPFVAVPDSWLLPPEPNKTEKEVARLSRELDRLKESEPHFLTRFVGAGKNEMNEIVVGYIIYEALVEDDVAALIDLLTTQFPVATDFGHREPIERFSLLGKEVYGPAKDEAIRNYTTKEYPSWLEGCKTVLSHLHSELQRQERRVFRFGATNEGIRPGKNVLVIISSRGRFKIRPPQIEGEYTDGSSEVEMELPEPPVAPQGEWKSSWSWLHDYGNWLLEASSLQDHLPIGSGGLIDGLGRSRDRDAFYYKPERPIEYVSGDRGTISGALECEIHAENLSTPSKSIIPVRITVRRVCVRDYAFDLVSKLVASTSEFK